MESSLSWEVDSRVDVQWISKFLYWKNKYLLVRLHPRILWILIQSQVNPSYSLTLLFI